LRLVSATNIEDPVWGNIRIYTNVAQVQTLRGITSKVGKQHMIFWDIENISLDKAANVLKRVQKKYALSNIYITSDKVGSYHAFCYSLVSFSNLLRILIDSKPIIDWSFFVWTCHRRAATIRLSKKKERPSAKLVKVLPSYFTPIPKKIIRVIYDTGLEKYPQIAV